MRILYCANAPWVGSGYGVQAQHLLPRLARLPQVENIAIFAYFGLYGGVTYWGPFTVYPAGADNYGNDVIGLHARDFKADVVITMLDVWPLKEIARKVVPAQWWPWFPVDSDPAPGRVVKALDGAAKPLVYSQWGQAKLAEQGVAATYVPIGIDPQTFRVLEPGMVGRFRADLFGADCTHLTVMVAANVSYPDRKAFQVQLRAWALFAEDKPGARLYIHTDPTTQHEGVDLYALAASLNIADKVIFPDRYQYFIGYPPEYLALVYNAADVLLAASMAEGFGIPLVEAQACGCPVIATNFSSMSELTKLGKATEPLDYIWTPLGSWQAWPDANDIANQIELYSGLVRGMEMRTQISKQIHEEFGWDAVVERHWAPLFEGA